jgi:hypothetical protein
MTATAIQAFYRWYDNLSADDTPRAGTDTEEILFLGFVVGFVRGYQQGTI